MRDRLSSKCDHRRLVNSELELLLSAEDEPDEILLEVMLLTPLVLLARLSVGMTWVGPGSGASRSLSGGVSGTEPEPEPSSSGEVVLGVAGVRVALPVWSTEKAVPEEAEAAVAEAEEAAAVVSDGEAESAAGGSGVSMAAIVTGVLAAAAFAAAAVSEAEFVRDRADSTTVGRAEADEVEARVLLDEEELGLGAA